MDPRDEGQKTREPRTGAGDGGRTEIRDGKAEADRGAMLRWARERLENLTPLKSDCGRLCGARCCESLEGEETGMLLFPGEEDFYESMEGWRMVPAGKDLLLICPGDCGREERPLACRIFPLLPSLSADGRVILRTDERARGICPLARQGKRGMDPAFVEAVRTVGETLAGEPEQHAFLRRLTAEQEELRTLRDRLTGRKAEPAALSALTGEAAGGAEEPRDRAARPDAGGPSQEEIETCQWTE